MPGRIAARAVCAGGDRRLPAARGRAHPRADLEEPRRGALDLERGARLLRRRIRGRRGHGPGLRSPPGLRLLPPDLAVDPSGVRLRFPEHRAPPRPRWISALGPQSPDGAHAIALFLLDRHFTLALGTFLVAALTDVADGWLARRWKQETLLGIVLDPLVDIVFNLAMFFALAAAELLPGWVFWVAALRYGTLLVGGACLYLFVGPLRIRPTLFGRLTGIVMSALVALLTLLHAVRGPLRETLMPLTQIALGVLISATVLQVVVMGWYNLRLMTGEQATSQGRVVGDVRWGRE
ncbi:MAG: CDP-alcohol phosphatidyltransferase family protein [Candidatus Eisenbacteria bacterium]|uniref:CDP-alcohol phosphatidyltransferase family protein n=1 Tax=Eiseniibacteriota bacterium TaxID=2212470 RepID=A0A538TPC4_UNCEI|nr:MAG: CDP-alcohol phosphatidyltransferase family protein [Candidatus Eisenbacteria bacterium]